ncbi:short-chain dehydrogenase, putative [Paecilomyces variotii No. 5]|uniref:Short-chain dehydrogenase, putative n=1 Tax=Byssochlamys spectabilis (strain No. 5 / NBRC 109023) TaxID=1356009 RepID=V5I0D9_BYSSN|nr:short-chain dehydrogenase, putative [Paecilomyces variotii No. 5]
MSLLSTAHGTFSTIFSNFFVPLPYPNTSFENQTIIVTGSNTGLGFEASRHLVRLGVRKLIMGVRNREKGEKAKREILNSTDRKDDCIEVWDLDMDSYDSVKKFAARATASLDRLDGLLANAGMMTTEFRKSEDNERTITVNVVSTFLLCLLLVPKLHESAEKFQINPRIVIPNSALHYMAPTKELDPSNGEIFARLNNADTADMSGRYPVSKLLVLYGVRELAQKLKSRKPLVIVNTPNPSFCKSGLIGQELSFGERVFERVLARSTEMGARALVHGLSSGVESHGEYLTNCHVQK